MVRQFLQQRDYSSGTKFRESRAQVGEPAQRTVEPRRRKTQGNAHLERECARETVKTVIKLLKSTS